MYCLITSIGCEFLGNMLDPRMGFNCPLLILKLDHNPLQSDGFKLLAKGLLMNKLLQAISVTYCEICDEAA